MHQGLASAFASDAARRAANARVNARQFKVGDKLIVRNGARGEQVAVVATLTPDGGIRVHKWLARGQRWTARVTIGRPEFLRFATPADFRKRRVKAMSPVG